MIATDAPTLVVPIMMATPAGPPLDRAERGPASPPAGPHGGPVSPMAEPLLDRAERGPVSPTAVLPSAILPPADEWLTDGLLTDELLMKESPSEDFVSFVLPVQRRIPAEILAKLLAETPCYSFSYAPPSVSWEFTRRY